jgi:hypothetical protein
MKRLLSFPAMIYYSQIYIFEMQKPEMEIIILPTKQINLNYYRLFLSLKRILIFNPNK